MGASGEEARKCAELIYHLSKLKAWEQQLDGAGMESASNSAPQAPIDPTGVNHDDARSEKLWMTPREATVT